MIREDRADVIYKTEQAKFNAVIEDIAERHQAGQPVLVGTVSVENSEILARLLTRRGIPHSVLNAKFHAREAEIVAQAGRKGAVTVATNMAGRGTDILLGGNPEFLAANELRQRGLDPLENAEEYDKALEEVLPKWKQACDAEAEEVAAPVGSTCWARNGTSPGGSTTSCVAGPAGRVTRASHGSTCPCRTS